jgi:ABC-type taurine transport system ATPase subunit
VILSLTSEDVLSILVDMGQRARYKTKEIRREMAARGLDRKWLERATGFSRQTMSTFFRGFQTVRVGAAISRALGYEPDYYLIDIVESSAA